MLAGGVGDASGMTVVAIMHAVLNVTGVVDRTP
jgi:hypothetical protein